MANWTITDNGTLIQIEHEGLEIFNNPKSDTEIKIVRAKTGDNTSSVDKLYIGFDTSWPCQINWNDVTVDGVAPTDVDDFSDKVEVVLNNVSSGGGSTAPITVDLADAGVMLAGVPAFPVEGQVYLINGLGITGVDNIRTVGILDVNTSDYVFNNNCEAYVTALGVYVPCTYDVATNKISGSYIVWSGDVSQNSAAEPTIVRTHVNLMGETPTFSYLWSGEYWLNTVTYSFLQSTLQPFSLIKVISGPTLAFYSLQYFGTNTIQINSGILTTGLSDDIMDTDYIEIKISF